MIEFSPKVLEAKKNDEPIVALESTIISHGMPFPQNIETAQSLEHIIKENNAIPATIAIHKGKIRVGLTDEILEHFATSKDILKASRRDMSYALSMRKSASTTVAATMICAQLANIDFFVTGGIGGVHPGAEQSFDISADLIELANTPINVICAGAKSILDLPKTLEFLETQGVPIIGYQTDDFPAFYSRQSGLKAPLRLNTTKEITNLIYCQRQLNFKSGIIIANPIPTDAEIPIAQIKEIINQAQSEALNISGKEITPFLLKRINALSHGKSLKANIALIENNAKLGAKIAFNYHNLTTKILLKP